MASVLEVTESPLEQGASERIAYEIDTAPWGGSASSPAVTVTERGDDVTGDVTSGSATITDDVIQTPIIQSLTAGRRYRVDVQWVTNGNTVGTFFEIKAR